MYSSGSMKMGPSWAIMDQMVPAWGFSGSCKHLECLETEKLHSVIHPSAAILADCGPKFDQHRAVQMQMPGA